jgi:hypothetical protein
MDKRSQEVRGTRCARWLLEQVGELHSPTARGARLTPGRRLWEKSRRAGIGSRLRSGARRALLGAVHGCGGAGAVAGSDASCTR